VAPVWEATFEELVRTSREKGLDARAFTQRRWEFEILFEHVRVPAGRSLEVGCGDGLLTALLAREGKGAVGVEMAVPDDLTCSLGMDAPTRLREALGWPHLHFLACRGEALAFGDESFDLVISSYVLEHVADRTAAIQEMKRVARRDARIVALVPAWMERVYAPFHYYPTMVWRIGRSAFRLAIRRFGIAQRPTAATVAPRSGPAIDGAARREKPEGIRGKFRKFFRVYHPTFPFPRPHGLYRSSSEELRAHRFGRWKAMFEREGLVVERAFATRIAPTCLLEMISDGADRVVQDRLAGLVRRRGEGALTRTFAYSYGFVLRKARA
jgi:SAM-dependent methyltransferase